MKPCSFVGAGFFVFVEIWVVKEVLAVILHFFKIIFFAAAVITDLVI